MISVLLFALLSYSYFTNICCICFCSVFIIPSEEEKRSFGCLQKNIKSLLMRRGRERRKRVCEFIRAYVLSTTNHTLLSIWSKSPINLFKALIYVIVAILIDESSSPFLTLPSLLVLTHHTTLSFCSAPLRYTKFQGEWDDFAAEEQAFKKYKKGKLSKDSYEEALFAESAPDRDQIENAAKKGTPRPIRFLYIFDLFPTFLRCLVRLSYTYEC